MKRWLVRSIVAVWTIGLLGGLVIGLIQQSRSPSGHELILETQVDQLENQVAQLGQELSYSLVTIASKDRLIETLRYQEIPEIH